MKFTGERVVFDQMDTPELQATMQDHVDRYKWALDFVADKVVLDAAAGTCYGSAILSTVAKRITKADISKESLDYGDSLTYFCPTRKVVADFEKDKLPACDVCVSFETIEHLANPDFFLKNLVCDVLLYSVPLYPGGKFHKYDFREKDEVFSLLRDCKWYPDISWVQQKRYLVGKATR